jgi:dolichol-phosphate mannosyltransferase
MSDAPGAPQRMSRAARRFLVVIPAYNEAATIEELIRRASRYLDVCVVDDCSTDGTADLVDATGQAHCIRHGTNTHIAGAILDGFRYAAEQGYDHCVTMDAGLSHDPDDLGRFMAHTDADLVLGYRAERHQVPVYRRALSWGGNLLINQALNGQILPGTGANYRDATSGYRMYSRRAYEHLLSAPLQSRAFDFHLEALALVHRAGMRVAETPIRYDFTNSSLRPGIVVEALGTCLRIWRTGPS